MYYFGRLIFLYPPIICGGFMLLSNPFRGSDEMRGKKEWILYDDPFPALDAQILLLHEWVLRVFLGIVTEFFTDVKYLHSTELTFSWTLKEFNLIGGVWSNKFSVQFIQHLLGILNSLEVCSETLLCLVNVRTISLWRNWQKAIALENLG